jgi:hypothetical protein
MQKSSAAADQTENKMAQVLCCAQTFISNIQAGVNSIKIPSAARRGQRATTHHCKTGCGQAGYLLGPISG